MMEMEKAQAAVDIYLSKQANLVDEKSVVALDDVAALEAGQTIYIEKCAACHGQLGEGGVGPNLTDPYWIHGGGVKEIFATIKYGVPEKGMISWKEQMNPSQMQKVSSFILTLQGTNPPNGKEPQGELWSEPQADQLPVDTTKALGML